MPKAQPRRRLADADYARLAEFRYLLRAFLTFSEAAAADAGITARQHQAMLMIRGAANATLTTGALAERLGLRHHSAVGLVDRLVANGLVTRRPGREDRRQVLLGLTPRARHLLENLSAAHRDELERLAPLLRTLLDAFARKP